MLACIRRRALPIMYIYVNEGVLFHAYVSIKVCVCMYSNCVYGASVYARACVYGCAYAYALAYAYTYVDACAHLYNQLYP